MKKHSKTERWFWAWLIQITIPKSKIESPTAEGEVWKNLVIIRADNEVEALTKAHNIGAQEEGDCDGTLRL